MFINAFCDLNVYKRLFFGPKGIFVGTLPRSFIHSLKLHVMNSLRNKVTLIGRLGKDPELTTFESGKKKVSFSLATSDVYRNKNGEKVENTEWHNVVLWGKTAEIANEYLKKGNEVCIEGRLTYRNYDDANGVTRYITEVVGNEMLLMEKKAKAEAETA